MKQRLQEPRMKLIAHRGNIAGPNSKTQENHPSYVMEAIDLGYDCEIDVWKNDDGWFLGHDNPQYPIDFQFLRRKGLWCHAKNVQALDELLDHKATIISVWIDTDFFPLTSNGLIWTHTDVSIPHYMTKRSVAIMPEVRNNNWTKVFNSDLCYGVCSDHVGDYKV